MPTNPVPHELLYHFQLAPVPKLPPVKPKVVLWPLQMVLAVAVTVVAGREVSCTVIVFVIQAILQVPSARNQ